MEELLDDGVEVVQSRLREDLPLARERPADVLAVAPHADGDEAGLEGLREVVQASLSLTGQLAP